MKLKFSLVLLSVILLAACSSKPSPTPTGTLPPIPASTSVEPLSGNVDVTIAGFAFDPSELTIKAGTTVTWTNQDGATHTVSSNDNSWGSGNLAKGDTFSFTFSQTGTFSYHCGFHASMKGTVTVVP